MEGYPTHYVSHNLPFVILFGLGSTDPKPRDVIEDQYYLLQEKGIYISSDLPNVTGPAAEELLGCFHDFDAKDAAWNNRPGKGKMGTTGFTYRSVGRVGQTPLICCSRLLAILALALLPIKSLFSPACLIR